MRLIDADKLKELFRDEEYPCALQTAILGIIDAQPTAYDPNKVAEQISKAVLVIDMPELCKKCVFCRGWNACKLKKYLVGDRMCTIYTVDKQIMEGGKPSWCPLRKLPEKMEVCGKYSQPGKPVPSYRFGWNACLKAILEDK